MWVIRQEKSFSQLDIEKCNSDHNEEIMAVMAHTKHLSGCLFGQDAFLTRTITLAGRDSTDRNEGGCCARTYWLQITMHIA